MATENTAAQRVLATWRCWQEAQGLSERTIREREYAMCHFFEHTNADPLSIEPDDIIAYTGRKGISQSSRATYHKHLRAYSKWLMVSGRRGDDPTLRTPVPKQPRGVPRPVGDGELARILAACNRRRTRMMVLLASLQGLRIHEVAKIRGEDIDVAAMTLTVNGKGGKIALLPLHETVATFASTFPAEGPWFQNYAQPDEPITAKAVGKAIRGAMRRAGVKRTPHSLRHWYGSELLKNGVSLRVVQELMRHESLATTQIYTFVPDDSLRAGVNGLRAA